MKLYNTMTREVEEFKPRNDNRVSLYTCGLTVYSQPHIGNWVAYIYWDVLERVLRFQDYDVIRVQNITDVGHLVSDDDNGEDKLQKGANAEGVTAWDIAKKYAQIADVEAYEKLKLLKPTHMPKATDYIQQQINFVRELESKGYTYIISDGVYFDTSKLDDYGKLARLDVTGLKAGIRVEDSGKKNPTDFALWKLSPNDVKRDMEWNSPWGKGFPGWHLECSVMARELLGDQIDIHAGGIDHIPIHHTNEIAQTEALTGKSFAQIWIHSNHIKVEGTKMSKSLGNIYTLDDILAKGHSLMAFKLLVLSKHYRTEGNFTWEILDAAQRTLENIQAWADLRLQSFSESAAAKENEQEMNEFTSEVLDDLRIPEALTKLFEVISNASKGIDSTSINSFVHRIDDLLGLGLGESIDITSKQKEQIKARNEAREVKNWELADKLRDELLEQGIMLNDGICGVSWERRQEK